MAGRGFWENTQTPYLLGDVPPCPPTLPLILPAREKSKTPGPASHVGTQP